MFIILYHLLECKEGYIFIYFFRIIYTKHVSLALSKNFVIGFDHCKTTEAFINKFNKFYNNS